MRMLANGSDVDVWTLEELKHEFNNFCKLQSSNSETLPKPVAPTTMIQQSTGEISIYKEEIPVTITTEKPDNTNTETIECNITE